MLQRRADLDPPEERTVTVWIDGNEAKAFPGETVLSTLFAVGRVAISKNDRGIVSGAYCGMGICYLCLVTIDRQRKARACQTEVREGMRIGTLQNHFDVIPAVPEAAS